VVVSLAHHSGTKRKHKARRKKWLSGKIYAVALVLMCLIIIAYVWSRSEAIIAKGGAVIVDSFHSSTPEFTDTTSAFLTSKGIHVDVYKDENVTVDLYGQLPALGYTLVILRVHAGIAQTDPTAPTFLFTNEPYNPGAKWEEQLIGQVSRGKINPDNPSEQYLFTIGPAFVAVSMEGNFKGSVVILSSCYGLYTDQLADAFVRKGAKVFIGWDEKVTLSKSDEACNLLLKALFDEKMPVEKAVEKVMNEVGEDKAFNSVLEYYPKEAGNLVVSP
jgi:hypothetical protein